MKNNRGVATIEVCFIVPSALFIVSFIIGIFLNLIIDSKLWSNGYVQINTYDYQHNGYDNISFDFDRFICNRDDITIADLEFDDGKIKMSLVRDNTNYNHQYMKNYRVYKYGREVDVLATRLRRWQLYGDFLQE